MLDGWIGVDFDGTLATYTKGQAPKLGEPIPEMVERVRGWLDRGFDVQIVTARVTHPAFTDEDRWRLEQWCYTHLGAVLPIRSDKDWMMIELWDDRAVQVETNTGRPIGVSRMGFR